MMDSTYHLGCIVLAELALFYQIKEIPSFVQIRNDIKGVLVFVELVYLGNVLSKWLVGR